MKNEPNPGQVSVLKNCHHDLPSLETIGAYVRPRQSTPEPLVYDINQVATLLNVCPKTVRRLIARGKLTTCKVLRKILIPREQIENFLKATCDKPNFGL